MLKNIVHFINDELFRWPSKCKDLQWYFAVHYSTNYRFYNLSNPKPKSKLSENVSHIDFCSKTVQLHSLLSLILVTSNLFLNKSKKFTAPSSVYELIRTIRFNILISINLMTLCSSYVVDPYSCRGYTFIYKVKTHFDWQYLAYWRQ